MFYVPIYVEGLRSRPVLVFWLATLTQAALWFLVPVLFYAAPPGGVAEVLAFGHQFPLDGNFGPPLAYWLAEIAFRLAGLPGVYALSQICLIATYWCVFALGRAIASAAHAALAVLLMIGISAFTVPTPDFGPPILTMALWAVVLLFYWRAVVEGRRRYWYALGVAAALLLLTSAAALILLGALILFTALTERGRAAIGAVEAWIAAVVLAAALVAHFFWLERTGAGVMPTLERLRDAKIAGANMSAWLWLLGTLILAHTGLVVLVVLASGWPRTRDTAVPALARAPVQQSAATYVKVFALLPALLATIATVLLGDRLPVGGAAPLLVLSALGFVVAAGDRIELHHQHILGFAWAGLLLVPAVLVPLAIVVLPWTTGTDLRIAQPARAMGRFFAESFERRTGHPLAVVGGETRTAALVALAAPSRPSVYVGGDPAGSRSITLQDIRDKGAIVVWPASETTPEPPPEIRARFPDLASEVPQTFERPVRGRLPPLRIGWGMIRPASAAAAAPAASAAAADRRRTP
jgi:Dolichyl-phosphate-mannose-protein mannosyltransferase